MSRSTVQQLVCGLLFLLAGCPAFGCTCVPGQLAVCQRLRSYHGSALFLGVAAEIRYKAVIIDKISFRQQVVRFSVEDVFAGVRSKSITVTEPPVCGYVFHKGVRYLVDAYGATESLEVSSCGMTTPAEYAADSIHFLRTLRQKPTGAIVFGTVKQYAKGSTFVSLNNKPVAGASVLLGATPDGLLREEERRAVVDSNGYYEFVGLPEGIYTHTVKVPEGFTGVLQHTVEVKKDSCAQVDVRVDGKTD